MKEKKYNLLDVGARNGVETILPYPYKSDLWDSNYKNKFNFYALEPDPEEALRLEKSNEYKQVLNYGAYYKPSKEILNITYGEGKSSILKPDLDNIRKVMKAGPLSSYIEEYKIKKTLEIQLDTIDELCRNIRVDLLKIDVQGLEYEVLQGCRKKMRDIKSIWLETSTIKSYKNQTSAELVIDLLAQNNFVPIYKQESTAMIGEFDYIFINKNHNCDLIKFVCDVFNYKSK